MRIGSKNKGLIANATQSVYILLLFGINTGAKQIPNNLNGNFKGKINILEITFNDF